MILSPTTIEGVVLVEPEWHEDERGRFCRTYSSSEFVRRGMDDRVAQCSTSFNPLAGTLRGMHYQSEPYAEAKLVRCTRGAIFDVAIDLREDSSSLRRWYGVELNANRGAALFIPAGCAHGFQTLEDDTEILYQISVGYEPTAARGARWDDPAFRITWPDPPGGERIMSERDAGYPNVTP